MSQFIFKIAIITEHDVVVEASSLYEAAKIISKNKKAGNAVYSDGTVVINQPSTRLSIINTGASGDPRIMDQLKVQLTERIRAIDSFGRIGMKKQCTYDQLMELDL